MYRYILSVPIDFRSYDSYISMVDYSKKCEIFCTTEDEDATGMLLMICIMQENDKK